MDELWEKFIASGSVSDYIRYISFKKSGEVNADNVKRSGTAREELRRER